MNNYLFPVNLETQCTDFPTYENYARVHRQIIQTLQQREQRQWTLFQTTDLIENFLTIIIELIVSEKIPYESLGYVYEARPTHQIVQNENSKRFHLKEQLLLDNQLIYFPEYEVGITRIVYYVEDDASWPELLLYGSSAESVIRFVESLNAQERHLMKTTLTYLIDTEEGIVKKRFPLGEKIKREDVFLAPSMKENIFRAVDEFFKDDGAFYKTYGLPYKRGILLHGAPGNGKTTLVRSITGTTPAPVIYWQITEHTGSYSVREVFQMVERMAPAILVIEDIDSMPEHMRSSFLNALDGVIVRSGLFIIGTTNYPERIDPALINRAGRFDSTYEIPSPSAAIRRSYLQKLDINELLADDLIQQLTIQTEGLSISQLNELYMSIALNYHYEGKIMYEERIKELHAQQKKAIKGNWDEQSSIGF